MALRARPRRCRLGNFQSTSRPRTGWQASGTGVIACRLQPQVGLAVLCQLRSDQRLSFEIVILMVWRWRERSCQTRSKSLDWKAREAKLICKMPPSVTTEALKKLNACCDWAKPMLHDFDQILKAALALPPGARAMLADHLLASLDLRTKSRSSWPGQKKWETNTRDRRRPKSKHRRRVGHGGRKLRSRLR